MKKRAIIFLLVLAMCLGLTACAKEEPWQSDLLGELESENNKEEATYTESEPQTENPEKLSVAFYTLTWDYGEITEIKAFGANLLVMALQDNQTQLFCVNPDDGGIAAQKALEEAYGITIEIVNSQVRMYQHSTMTWTWLDEQLQIIEQYTLPFTAIGKPYMDAGNQYIYYVDDAYQLVQYKISDDTKHVIDSGFDAGANIYLENILDGGNFVVLSSYVDNLDGVGGYRMHFVDTQLKKVVGVHDSYITVNGWENYFCTELYTGGKQLVYGRYDKPGTREIIFKDYDEYSQLCTFPEAGKVMTWQADDWGMGQFSLYSMGTGKKEACYSLELEKDAWGYYRVPWQAVYIQERDIIVFSYADDSSRLLVWNTTSSLCEDEYNYTRAYLPWSTEDSELLSQLRTRAVNLGKEHGVHIYIGEACPIEYYGYLAQRTFSVRAIEQGLNIVEKALKAYPDGFFKQLTGTRGMLKICLVDALYPDGSDSLSTTTGLYNYDDSSQMIVLSLSAMDEIEDLFYHEMSHAIDMKLYDTQYQWYTEPVWDAINPDGFCYDNSYVDNASDVDGLYVWGYGEEAYFIDSYSKSFATEDRARLMEYAIGKYPETNCFESKYLLEKLEHRAGIIRSCFDTTGWPEVTSWERPLS